MTIPKGVFLIATISQKTSSDISTASAARRTKNIFLLEYKKNLFLLSKT